MSDARIKAGAEAFYTVVPDHSRNVDYGTLVAEAVLAAADVVAPAGRGLDVEAGARALYTGEVPFADLSARQRNELRSVALAVATAMVDWTADLTRQP